MKTTYVDLVTARGEIVRIECPQKFENELHESIEHAMKCRDWWSPRRFDGCTASFMGQRLSRVNMGEIIGML